MKYTISALNSVAIQYMNSVAIQYMYISNKHTMFMNRMATLLTQTELHRSTSVLA